ncbi:HAD-IB family phosphatase [Haloferula chungangensis]|uniref:phosphoserine phosphatase n=1 Tax=Haloferula chungangensis TaxID=1048331 RepID=A0ABW2L778_9BACT
MSDYRIEISVDDQQLKLIYQGELIRSYPVSTARKGVGTQEGSFRTPTGNFVISEMIGAEAPSGTIFKGRIDQGVWDACECEQDLVLTRILWLDGLDASNRNTKGRYIYIHGTNHESLIGSPASCGCVRMTNRDIIELFNLIETGTPVTIHPPIKPGGKLIFFDCDSTLSTIEGIDELGRARGPEIFAQVEDLTNAAMNGEIPIQEVFPKRMEIIRPDRSLCDEIAELYVNTITPGTEQTIAELKQHGWTPIILSGGFAPLIMPLARHLGIDHVEAVPLNFDDQGNYVDFDANYPTTRNGGKPDIIREWKHALLPTRTIMVGDGISDLESRRETDFFVGYGGVVAREAVRSKADAWIEDMTKLNSLIDL